MNYIKKFEDIRLQDIPQVGGKNASLGEMIAHVSDQGVKIPGGFATLADAYWHFLDANNLKAAIEQKLAQCTDEKNLLLIKNVSKEIRDMIQAATMPDDLKTEIVQAYKELSARYNQENCDVAVRSSATAEDLPSASFAGAQETFLNVRGDDQLIQRCIDCYASLFTERAIIYRIEQGFEQEKVALSIGVQKMVRSDKGCSGVAFTLDTESGFKDVVVINAAYGLGEAIVKGLVTPDEFVVYKPLFQQGFPAIIKKRIGQKQIKIIYADGSETKEVEVPQQEQQKFSLSDADILALTKAAIVIERYYSTLKNKWSPMDIEWAKDGVDGTLYIVQARPETVYASQKKDAALVQYSMKDRSGLTALVTGNSIGQQIVSGKARVIKDVRDIDQLLDGEILVTQMTDPDWVPAMKKAAGIITERGGRTCHAAIVSRELGRAALVGAENALTLIKNGQEITLDCSQGETGYVYEGIVPFETTRIEVAAIPKISTAIMVNIAQPETVFVASQLPVDGVGLARIEFIISGNIQVHPMALVHPEKIDDSRILQKIDELTAAYPDKKTFFVDSLAQGVGMIAAAFYPKPVVVRFSDFKTNEYRNLLGGSYFEPEEENPMLGFRGASRYVNPRYRDAFALECAALKKVRDEMGFTNVIVMVPFVRTVQEGKAVVEEMEAHGLKKGDNGLKIIMMCEIPSNVLLIDEFSKIFDGFSIGSNDLTQLTLGVDRDSEILAPLFDERDPAVMKILTMAVQGAHQNDRPIGICGQAPSDYPEIGDFLIKLGINSLSLNQDSVIPFLMRHAKK